MGNLLTYKSSFEWEDSITDRSTFIENLTNAITEARTFGDRVFRTPDLHNLELSWGNFFNALYNPEERQLRFPWLTDTLLNAITQILNVCQSTTPDNAANLNDLTGEFINENNGAIGFHYNPVPNPFVHDLNSWNEFHKSYVTNNINVRRNNYEYFRRFYVPTLTMTVAQIQHAIGAGHAPYIVGINAPVHIENDNTLHHEKIHIHFTDGSALNIDGTWKHGNSDIPNAACIVLEGWGFMLPEGYYN